MKTDVLGQELKVGDFICYCSWNQILFGFITKMTSKNICVISAKWFYSYNFIYQGYEKSRILKQDKNQIPIIINRYVTLGYLTKEQANTYIKKYSEEKYCIK